MSKEHRQPPRRPTPAETFGLTERERRSDRVSHTRFLELLDDPATRVHRIEESTNSFGEYLFVTLSRPGSPQRIFMTFFGLGFHEYRERWILDEWFWYQAVTTPALISQHIRRETAQRQIENRYRMVQEYAGQETQTRRGQVFEMIADLTDEDGAWAEMEDLPGWLLDDEDDEGLR